MTKPLFQIIFDDKTSFFGGDYKNTKWKDIPNKKIRILTYLLPTQDYLVLQEYEKYYHFIECTQDLTGNKAGIENLEFAYLIAKKENESIIYKINLKNSAVEIIRNDNIFLEKLNKNFWH